MASHLLQLNVEKQQQHKASVVPVSRLQGLRDRDTVTRFDQEVSASLQRGCTLFKLSTSLYSQVIRCGQNPIFFRLIWTSLKDVMSH